MLTRSYEWHQLDEWMCKCDAEDGHMAELGARHGLVAGDDCDYENNNNGNDHEARLMALGQMWSDNAPDWGTTESHTGSLRGQAWCDTWIIAVITFNKVYFKFIC